MFVHDRFVVGTNTTLLEDSFDHDTASLASSDTAVSAWEAVGGAHQASGENGGLVLPNVGDGIRAATPLNFFSQILSTTVTGLRLASTPSAPRAHAGGVVVVARAQGTIEAGAGGAGPGGVGAGAGGRTTPAPTNKDDADVSTIDVLRFELGYAFISANQSQTQEGIYIEIDVRCSGLVCSLLEAPFNAPELTDPVLVWLES
jgi:hypothetical protein